MLKLGVIVSSYNRPLFIRQALESLVSQTIADQILVVVVDDGSIQEVKDIINSFSEETVGGLKKSSPFGGFKLINSIPVKDDSERVETNRVSIGVNQGLRYIWSLPDSKRPEYLSYLGDDDLYFSSRCEKMVNFLEQNPDIFLAYHFMEIHECDKEGNLTAKLLDLKEHWDGSTKFWVEHIYNRIDHISFVHRDKNYIWDEDVDFRRSSDWGFLLRVLALEERFASVPEYLAQGRKIKGDSINIDGLATERTELGKEVKSNGA